jgi:hypothetical protein
MDEINGFRYGLFANEEMNEPKRWGNNCLPSLEVNDMDQLIGTYGQGHFSVVLAHACIMILLLVCQGMPDFKQSLGFLVYRYPNAMYL